MLGALIMARGTRASLDDKIAELRAKVEKKEQETSELKKQVKELENQRRIEMLSKVEAVAKEKGISVDELLESLVK
jgi:cell division protein FtsL